MTTELVDLTAESLSRGIASREFSCREVMQATLARVDRVNPTLNAIVSFRDDSTWVTRTLPVAALEGVFAAIGGIRK